MSSKRPYKIDESQEQSELEISAITSSDDDQLQEPPKSGVAGLVGRLFRLPWGGSEPIDHDRGRALRRAVRAEDLPLIKKMLQEGVGVNESQEASLACIATRRRNLELLDLLIKAGVDLDQGDRRNRASRIRTPLHEAARKGWLEGVDLLLKSKADLEVEDDAGATALVLAVRASKHGVVKRLLAVGANTQASPVARMAPIHEASTPEMVDMLLEAGASLEEKDKTGATALYHHAKAGRTEMVKVLLELGAQVDAVDNRGRSALFAPGAKGDVQGTFQALFDASPQQDLRDQDLNAFVHLAATRCVNPKVLEWLYGNTSSMWSLKNRAGETPTDILTARGFHPLAMRIRSDDDRRAKSAERVESTPSSLFDMPRS